MINPFGFIITIIYYKLGLLSKKVPILNKFPPVVFAGILLILTLVVFKIDFNKYNESASYLTLCLIPSTIALGYPIYKNLELLKKYKRIIYTSFFIAAITAICATYIIAKLCHGELSLIESLLPKSVTTPIAIEISKMANGIPELTACVVVLTGIFGAMFGHKILKLIKVKNDVAIGLSIGAASHVIGSAKCAETKREKQIVMASIALVIVGILTAIIVPVFLYIVKMK